MNQSHWDKAEPKCNPCINEQKVNVREGRVTQKEFDSWKKGEFVIGITQNNFIPSGEYDTEKRMEGFRAIARCIEYSPNIDSEVTSK